MPEAICNWACQVLKVAQHLNSEPCTSSFPSPLAVTAMSLFKVAEMKAGNGHPANPTM